jgi:exodeoxyribonuclease V beta subunit
MDKAQHVPKPSPLDWLLRTEKEDETHAAWYARILKQKQKRVGKDGKPDPDWLCEHGASLRELQEIFDKKDAAAKSLLSIIDAGDVKACQSKWKRTSDDAPAGEAHESPPALKGWRLTSFSGLTHSSEDEKDRRDAPGAPMGEEIPSAPAAGNPLLEAFPSSNHVGNLFHGILEKWDFSDMGPTLDETIRGALAKRAISIELPAGETPEARLKKILASWATVELPGVHPQAKLGTSASHPEWSELPFLMPIAEAGLGGDALRAIFERHFAGDERGLEYARTLSDLKKESIQGMLHGFIDRLACHENQWAVLDWKSNRLSRGKSEDYSTGSLWNSAAENHYILQLHLYMVAVRRHLARHPASVLKGAALLYLRGLEGGGDRGVLWFDARPGLLDDLDRLFAAPRELKETP